MLEINEDVLCDFCKGHYDTSFGSNCAGMKCEEITAIYLEDVGVTDDSGKERSFGSLNIGDKLFIISDSSPIPQILVKQVNSLSQMNGEKLSIHYESTSVSIEDSKATEQDSLFLSRIDCDKRLEEICVKMIIDLSKVIGGL